VSREVALMLDVVRRILWDTWDPIGVNDVPEAFGEYDSYAPTVVSRLVHGCSAPDLDFHLARIEMDSMGLSGRKISPPRSAAVAALIALRESVSLPKPPLEVLQLEAMASGNDSLRLTTKVTWEDFPTYAKQIIGLLGGTLHDRADSLVERVWPVTIFRRPFWIAFDDFGLGVSIDPRDPQAAHVITEVRDHLLTHR
jgi:hypothetical protein